MRPIVMVVGATTAVGYHFYALDKARFKGDVHGILWKHKVLQTRFEELSKQHSEIEVQHNQLLKEHDEIRKEHEEIRKEHNQILKEYAIIKERLSYLEATVKNLLENGKAFKKFMMTHERREKEKQEGTWRNLFSNIFPATPKENDFRKGK